MTSDTGIATKNTGELTEDGVEDGRRSGGVDNGRPEQGSVGEDITVILKAKGNKPPPRKGRD